MSEKSPAVAPAKSNSRSRVALLILILVAAFFGYGVFERSRLLAAQAKEKEAIKFMSAINGSTVESDVKDWRLLFVPDQPEAAIRVGTIVIPVEGDGPNYTNKIVEQIRQFPNCEQAMLRNSLLAPKGGRDMGGGSQKPKEDEPKKEEKSPKQPQELLDLDAIRKEFPQLKIYGEEAWLQVKNKGSANESTTKEEAPKEEAPPPAKGESEEKPAPPAEASSGETGKKTEPEPAKGEGEKKDP